MSFRGSDAWRDATARYTAVLDALPTGLPLTRTLPPIRLRRVAAPGTTARIRQSPQGRVSIEFGDEFMARLMNLVEQLRDEALYSLLDLPGPSVPEAHLVQVRVALYSFAEQFVFHHELFHLLCGHLDQRVASSARRQLALEELGVATLERMPPKLIQSVEALNLLPLYIELEADNSALQFLFDKCLIGDMDRVFPKLAAQNVPLSQADGPDRPAAFRLCFAAVWLVLLLFEGVQDGQSRSHPWPATRLLALLFTLLPYFADIPDRVDEVGEKHLTLLTDRTAAATREFLLEVVRPAMKFVLAHADADEVLRRYHAPDAARSSLFADVLHDLQGLMFDTAVMTPGGRQLRELRDLRPHFASLFKPYCYFDF